MLQLAVRQIESPLGSLLIAADEQAVRLVEYASGDRSRRQLAKVRDRLGLDAVERESLLLTRLSQELAAYFAGELRRFTVPCRAPGTPFQQLVWRELANVPCGRTRSYAEIASAIGQPSACRAVGSANGANPISILLPCHRVVRSDGALGGYGGGLVRKRWLLEHETSHRPQKRFSYAG